MIGTHLESQIYTFPTAGRLALGMNAATIKTKEYLENACRKIDMVLILISICFLSTPARLVQYFAA